MIICQCNGITEKEIVRAIKKKGATKVEHIQRLTGAGTNCGRCIPVINRLLDENKQKISDPQLKLDL
jgi:NAD(P)H-nitrite reductase large subunit